MTKKLRVGVIGAGIAARHMIGYDWNRDLFEVPVLCSLDADRGQVLRRKRVQTGVEERLQHVRVDVAPRESRVVCLQPRLPWWAADDGLRVSEVVRIVRASLGEHQNGRH